MSSVYTRKTDAKSNVRYRNVTENKQVAPESLDEALLARLDVAPEGTKVSESSDIVDTAGTANVVSSGVKTRSVFLSHPLLVNGVVFKGGEDIDVPEEQADDLLRIDRENSQYEANLVKSQNGARSSDVRVQDVQ